MKTNKTLPQSISTFESIKKINKHGIEYWSARDLQNLLGYIEWRNFETAIQKAIKSCEKSSNSPLNHFVGANKMVDLGSNTFRKIMDFHLSRFACYLIAQNGDPRKEEIANAQKYFAIQTRKQELSEALISDLERIEMRKQISEEFKALSGAAREAGVQNKMFGLFHDAGYKGLYGGLSSSAIKERKGIPVKEQLMDRMGTTELAANQFRMTQTRDKLKKENIKDQKQAINTHEDVGKEVRKAIQRIGGTLPENIPPEENIKKLKKRIKLSKTKIEIDKK
jgi:DNA-damage-inducible protein D